MAPKTAKSRRHPPLSRAAGHGVIRAPLAWTRHRRPPRGVADDGPFLASSSSALPCLRDSHEPSAAFPGAWQEPKSNCISGKHLSRSPRAGGCSKRVIYLKSLSESESRSVPSASLRSRGVYSPWDSPGQNTGVGSLSLLQGISPTQGSNPGLSHCRQILYQLSHLKPHSNPMGCVSVWSSLSCVQLRGSLRPPGLHPARLLCSWDSPGKNTGVGCHFLPQGIFPTQGPYLGPLHCRLIFYA